MPIIEATDLVKDFSRPVVLPAGRGSPADSTTSAPADPLRARARWRERDAKPGGRLRITARSLMVLRKHY